LTDAEEKEQGQSKEKFKLKYYAVFMAEGGGMKKYHFRDVYDHILRSLPDDIIAYDGAENQE